MSDQANEKRSKPACAASVLSAGLGVLFEQPMSIEIGKTVLRNDPLKRRFWKPTGGWVLNSLNQFYVPKFGEVEHG